MIVPLLTGAAETPRGAAYFVAAASSVNPDTEVSVGVMLDAPFPVNVISIELAYSPETLSFVAADTSESVLDVWRKGPEIYRDGIVRLEGGATKPFRGRANEIAKLSFRVRPGASGVAQWSFRSTRAIIADGLGTELVLDQASLSIPLKTIGDSPSPDAPGVRGALSDRVPPRIALITVVPNPAGDEMLGVWGAHDGESGIARAEVRFLRWLSWSSWTPRDNPVRMPQGAWGFAVRVTDHAGNHAERTVMLWSRAIPIAFVLVVVGLAAVWIFHRRKTRRVLQ